MGGILESVALITTALSGLIGAGTALFGAKSIKAPELPVFKIPDADMAVLKDQIEKNKAISDEARKAAVQALEAYNQGRLSPAYEAMYNEYAREATQRVMQELAARGFSPGSSEYTRVMNQLSTQLNAYRAQLQRVQLEDALRVSGLSETTIRDLYNKWSVESAATSGAAQAALAQWEAKMRGREYELARGRMIGEAFGTVGRTLGDILKTPIPAETVKTEEPIKAVSPGLLEDYLSLPGEK